MALDFGFKGWGFGLVAEAEGCKLHGLDIGFTGFGFSIPIRLKTLV